MLVLLVEVPGASGEYRVVNRTISWSLELQKLAAQCCKKMTFAFTRGEPQSRRVSWRRRSFWPLRSQGRLCVREGLESDSPRSRCKLHVRIEEIGQVGLRCFVHRVCVWGSAFAKSKVVEPSRSLVALCDHERGILVKGDLCLREEGFQAWAEYLSTRLVRDF